MKSICVKCKKFRPKNSSYKRKCDGQIVYQFRCFSCNRTWTPKADNPEKRQKLRSINEPLSRLLVSGVSMRRSAWILGVSRRTIERRISYLSERAKREFEFLAESRNQSSYQELYIDELITYEHTRCKPLALAMVVNKNREILSFRVSSMPAIGKHLKKVSLKKYGKRKNHRENGVRECLLEVKKHALKETPVFKSDEEASYQRQIKRIFPNSKHETYPSKRAVVAGQGELKEKTFDPIFAINHTFASMRYCLARLIRKTWSNTKTASRLEDFIWMYAASHNHNILSQIS